MPLESLGTLSPEALAALKQAKLLIVPRGSEVWIDSADKARALELMGQQKSPQEKIYRFHGFTVRMPSEIVLEQRWYGYLNNTIGRQGRIHIHEFSKPADGLDRRDTQKVIDAVKIRKEEIKLGVNSFTPAYSGIVMCDDGGIPMFEVTPFNIYVLFDTRAQTATTKKIYEQMLMFALVLANHQDQKSKDVYDEIWASQSPERERYEIKQFEDMILGGIKNQEKTLAAEIQKYDVLVKQSQQAIYTAIKNQEEAQIKLQGVKAVLNGGMEKKAKEEWDKLKNLERSKCVRNLKVTADAMSFITRKVCWTPKKETRLQSQYGDADITIPADQPVELGEFNVNCTIGSNFTIHIENLTKTLSYDGDRWHHPHIRQGGICHGNMTQFLPEFAARREFEAIVMCILKWLENVDFKDPWGKGLAFWAVEDKKRRDKEAKDAEKAAEKKAAEKSKEEEKAKTPVLEA